MGYLEKWREWPGKGSARSVIVVPGVSAASLEQQTCSHFPKFIEACYIKPDTAVTIWVYNHGVKPRSRECWESFYQAGDDLLEQVITIMNNQPDVDLVLIGHRLGVFLLKKALVLADRRAHTPGPAAVFEALQKIIMIGDPCLHDENRSEWSSLIRECLQHSKKLAPDVYSEETLDGLKRISDMFEKVTLYSQFFQVSGKATSKRKSLLRLKSTPIYRSCLCDANISVRMWTTADEDEAVELGEGSSTVCVFHQGSKCHKPLLTITGGDYKGPTNLIAATPLVSEISKYQGQSPQLSRIQSLEWATAQDSHNSIPSGPNLGRPNALDGTANNNNPEGSEDGLQDESAYPVDNSDLYDDPTPDSTPELSPTQTAGASRNENNNNNPGYFCDHANDIQNLECATPLVSRCGTDISEAPSIISGERVTSPNSDSLSEISTQDEIEPAESEEMNRGPRGMGGDVVSRDNINEMQEDLSKLRPRPLPLRHGIPPRCEYFVGRTKLLDSLNSFLATDSGVEASEGSIRPNQRIAILYGPAGIGKTQAALEFIAQHGSHFDSIFWIRSDTQADLARSFHAAAIAIGLINGRKEHNHKISTAMFKNWLQHNKSRWLLIFDDANDEDTLAPYIPNRNAGGAIIITRRWYTQRSLQLPDPTSSVRELDVPPMSPKEGHELFKRVFGSDTGELDGTSAGKLIELLQGHTLALSHVALYMKATQKSIPQTISAIENELSTLNIPQTPDLHPTIRHVMGSTQLSPRNSELGAVWSCLDTRDMNESILLAAAKRGTPFRNLPTTRADLGNCAGHFETLGYIMPLEEGRYCWRHESLQDAFHSMMSLQQKIDALNTTSLLLLSQWPSPKKFRHVLLGFWPEFDNIHSHVRRLFKLWIAVSPQSGSLNALIRDEAFSKLLTLSTWYNANVRGNGDEDLNLQEFMHTIHDCRRQESESSTIKNLPSQAPSRLLYFDHDHKICRLVETNGRFFSYVALSYVWHSEQNMPRLTRDTYDHFKKGIPYSDIRLLNSASFFMEQADVQYLWVDSCCIVQDDSADVAAELSTMSGTYANSMATIVSSSPYRSEARLSANRWWSRGWILQEELLSGRQLVLGDFALRSHESDKFSQTWFSRVVAKFVNMSLDGCGIDSAYRSSGCPSISCQHQDCDTYYFLLKGDKESLFVDLPEDLVKALQQSFSWSFKSKAQQKPPHEQTYTPSNANIYTTEENKKDTKEELTVDTCAQEKTSSSESTDRAWQLLHEGYKLFEDRSTVQALAKFFLAREHVSSAVSESSDALKIHILTSVYIANFYLQEKSFDTAMEVVQTPKNRMLGCNIFEEPLLPIVAQLYLTEANVFRAKEEFEKATQLYQRVIDISKDTEGEAADFGAIAKLKLAESYLSDNAEEAINLIKESVSHFEDQTTRRGQAQYARALYYKALASAQPGKKLAAKRARRALEDLCDEHGLTEPKSGELTKEDFESVLDLGFL